jgi:hypothetical protein
VFGAIGVFGATSEAGLVGAGPACSIDALLVVGARRIEARREALTVDADARVATFEIELASKRGRLRFFWLSFERIQTQAVVGAGGPNGALVCILTLGHAADRRADLAERAVRFRKTGCAVGRGLRIALVPLAEKAAPLVERPVGDADVAGVVVAAGDPE